MPPDALIVTVPFVCPQEMGGAEAEAFSVGLKVTVPVAVPLVGHPGKV